MKVFEIITGHVIYNLAYNYKFQLKTTQDENKDFDNYENFNQDDLRDPDMTTIGTGKSDIYLPTYKLLVLIDFCPV